MLRTQRKIEYNVKGNVKESIQQYNQFLISSKKVITKD